MNADQLLSLANEAREMAGKATAGPWTAEPCISDPEHATSVTLFAPPDGNGLSIHVGDLWLDNNDADFIAHSRLAVPVLAEAVIALMPHIHHDYACHHNLDESRACSCGLDAALKSLEKT